LETKSLDGKDWFGLMYIDVVVLSHDLIDSQVDC
jgi:hypothetical protein